MGEYLAMAFLITTSLLGIILLARLCRMQFCGGMQQDGVRVISLSGEAACAEWILRRLLYQGVRQIVVVDLGCSAQTREILRRFCNDHASVTVVSPNTEWKGLLWARRNT